MKKDWSKELSENAYFSIKAQEKANEERLELIAQLEEAIALINPDNDPFFSKVEQRPSIEQPSQIKRFIACNGDPYYRCECIDCKIKNYKVFKREMEYLDEWKWASSSIGNA